MKTALGGLATALTILGRVFLVAMMAITVVDILSRHLLGRPIPGVVDLVELSLAVTIFAGIALACWRGVHLAVDFLEIVLPRPVLRALDHANGAVMALVCAIMAWLSYIQFLDALDWGDTTVDLGIPLTWYWVSPVVGFGCAAVFALYRTLRIVFASREPE